MKTRIQKIVLLPGAMLYLLTAAYLPGLNLPLSVLIADNSGSPCSDGGVMQPQSDPFPICPQCTSMSAN